MRVAIVYSRQPGNAYVGGSNENVQMFSLASKIVPILRSAGHEVEIPPNTDYDGSGSLTYNDNVRWVNDRHAVKAFNLLISFHSNAAGDSCILWGNSAASRTWAEKFQTELNSANFMYGGDKWEFNTRKVSEMTATSPPGVLLEVGRHDTAVYASWLKTNIANGNLAQWLGASIIRVIGGNANQPTPTPTPDVGGWDTHHKKLAIKVIGTVESNMKYDAINYRDPITVGAFQWYGERAAQVLRRMKNENPGSWTGVASSINNDLVNRPQSNDWAWWTKRYLTQAEGNSIKPVLLRNVAIQNDQVVKDLEAYRKAYEALGGDSSRNTKAMVFFMSMHHQRPASARDVVRAAGANADASRLRTFAARDAKFSQFKSRYDTTLAIILANDVSGIEFGGPDPGPVTPGNPDDDPDNFGDPEADNDFRLNVDATHIIARGNNLVIQFKDGKVLTCPPVRSGMWLVSSRASESNSPGIDPTPPPAPEPTAHAGQKALEWMLANQEKWAYGQGSGRLDPWRSGYTDCSACVYLAYLKTSGINIGTWTTAQSVGVSGFRPPGKEITRDRETIRSGTGLLPGDLIFYRAYVRNTHPYNHVEMYTGDASRRTIGQVGSTAPGPSLHSMNRYLDWGKLAVLVRRPWQS